ncbi:hypothetical protein DFH09DRAFT_909650, partial [Mycena vulgaris]
DLDDTAVVQMAHSWPRLQCLSLKARPFRHMLSRVTFEGLYAFAERCPSLCILRIMFDATSSPELGDTKRAAQKSLCNLDVFLSPIENLGRVAVFLSTIFPELTLIGTS